MSTPNSNFAQGVDALHHGNVEEALNLFRMASKADTSLVDAWVATGLCSFWLGKASLALEALESAIRIQPDCADAYAVRADVNGELERWRDAANDGHKARQLGKEGALAGVVSLGGRAFALASPIQSFRRNGPDVGIQVDQSSPLVVAVRDQLRGAWRIASLWYDGQPIAESVGRIVECMGDQIRLSADRPSEVSVDIFRLDPTTVPPRIDLSAADMTSEPSRQGVYRLEEDRWIICHSSPNHPRPLDFEPRTENGQLLMILERVTESQG